MSADLHIPLRRKVLYSAIITCLAFFLGEVALRIRQQLHYGALAANVRDSMLVYDPKSDLFVPRPGYEVTGRQIHIKINSLGFRGDEIARTKPAHTVRVACLGASTTFGAESSSDDATWPHRLQERLARSYSGVSFEVINAAVGGYVASDNLKNLRSRILPLSPDLVIYYEANNQIVHDTRLLAQRQGLLGENGTRDPSFIRTLSRYSLFVDLVYKNAAIQYRSHVTSHGGIDRIPRSLPEGFIAELDEMRTVLDAAHVPLLLSTFIVKFRRDQERRIQIRNADVEFVFMPWMTIDGMLDAIDVYNQAILSYAARMHLPVVDNRTAVPPDDEHFSDSMHFRDKGDELMAARFFEYLTGSGLADLLVQKVR